MSAYKAPLRDPSTHMVLFCEYVMLSVYCGTSWLVWRLISFDANSSCARSPYTTACIRKANPSYTHKIPMRTRTRANIQALSNLGYEQCKYVGAAMGPFCSPMACACMHNAHNKAFKTRAANRTSNYHALHRYNEPRCERAPT
jgi:hypothetical protein